MGKEFKMREEIKWMLPIRKGYSKIHMKDVLVSIVSWKRDGAKRTTITFRNDCVESLAGKNGRLMVGVGNDCLYFQENIKGYKLQKSGKKNVKIVIPAILTDFVGEYDLQTHDVEDDIYFIEKERER